MSKEEYILIITEGESTEIKIIENLQKIFFNENEKKNQILLSFKTNIYQLWKQLKKDDFETDIIEVLIERDEKIEQLFEKIDKNCISQKYLFFDYDGHDKETVDKNIGDDVIEEMLNNFDNETEDGKLYISYPMVEAIRHLKKNALCSEICCVQGKVNINYKDIVAHNNNLPGLEDFNKKRWNTVLNYGVKKGNCLINNKFQKPSYNDYKKQMSQINIFKYQLEKYAKVKNDIAILSGFPFFLIDYFGENLYITIKEDNFIKLNDKCNTKI